VSPAPSAAHDTATGRGEFAVTELAAARTMVDEIGARSGEIETARQVPGELVRRMHQAGLFDVCVPRAYGGAQRTALEVLQLIETIAYADSAAGWLTMIYGVTAVTAASLPPEWAERIYGSSNPSPITSGATAPTGRATRVSGGLSVTGRWAWGSGAAHSDWICGGTLVEQDGEIVRSASGAPRVLVVFFEASQVTLHDNWDASGLRGTGSVDFDVDGAFVPEGRWIALGEGVPLQPGALYQVPFFGLFAAAVAAVPLGIARRALDDFTELARRKIPAWGRQTINESSLVQLDLGRAEARVEGARRYLFDVVGEVQAEVTAGRSATLEHRRQLRLAASQAAVWCSEAVDIVYEAGGGTSVLATCPLQRHFRDVHTATGHRMISRAPVRLAGALRLTDVELGASDL
jgi:indole-3-acetate monooxygenase